MSDQQQDQLAELWDRTIEDRLRELPDSDFRALVARVRPADPPPPSVPLTPYEVARTQNAARRDAFGAKVNQLLNLPTDQNGAPSSFPAAVAGRQPAPPPDTPGNQVERTELPDVGAPESPESAAPAPPPQPQRPSLNPLGLSPASAPTSGARGTVGLEPPGSARIKLK